MARYSTVGKADLLRALAVLGVGAPDEVSAELLDRLASRFRLAARQSQQEPTSADVLDGKQANDDTADRRRSDGASIARRPPLQARFFTVLHREDRSPSEQAARDDSFAELQPLTRDDCLPDSVEQVRLPLVRSTRLWPALRRALGRMSPGCIDISALTRRLARAENIRCLPRRARHHSGGEVWIIADRSKRLLPYAFDYRNVVNEVARLCGVGNVRMWNVLEKPDAVLSMRRGRQSPQAASDGIPMPPQGTPVLILSDLGQLAPARWSSNDWIAFCKRMTRAGARLTAWVPMSDRLVSREVARSVQVHCLGAGDLRPLKPGRCALEPTPPVSQLCCMLRRMACCVRVEPALLRALRLVSTDTASEPGLEGLLWSVLPEVRAGYGYCEISAEAQTRWRQEFSLLGNSDAGRAEQDEILMRIVTAHRARGRSTESVEILLWEAHTGREAPIGLLAERAAKAHQWLVRLGRFPHLAPGDVVGYAQDLFARQGGDERFMKEQSINLGPLFRLTGAQSVPRGLLSADILDGARERVRYEIVQQGASLTLSPARPQGEFSSPSWVSSPYFDPSQNRWVGLARNVVTHSQLEVGSLVEWATYDGSYRVLLDVPEGLIPLPLPMPTDGADKVFRLATATQTIVLAPMKRPTWAEEWGFYGGVLQARAPSPFGDPVLLETVPWAPEPWQGQWPLSPRAFQAAVKPLGRGTGMTLGADLQFGLYLDIPFGSAIQRFRWIESGEFLMGSPEGEEGRFDNEGPLHLVRLTEGFWLAETACSQSVWVSVMGSNPSRFSDNPQNPVERVSWNDVQVFLQKVEKRFPGLKADLPSEAEWEFACRAGSQTAFSWGGAIAPSQANYDTRSTYANGATGKWRRKTVPVQSFAPNAWGFYQMHGNVWEWCADGPCEYDVGPYVDPMGPKGDMINIAGEGRGERWATNSLRVVRGGSWSYDPSELRAAYRLHRLGGERDEGLGFRFSLRARSNAERPSAAPDGA